jgi:hypothetical protein
MKRPEFSVLLNDDPGTTITFPDETSGLIGLHRWYYTL